MDLNVQGFTLTLEQFEDGGWGEPGGARYTSAREAAVALAAGEIAAQVDAAIDDAVSGSQAPAPAETPPGERSDSNPAASVSEGFDVTRGASPPPPDAVPPDASSASADAGSGLPVPPASATGFEPPGENPPPPQHPPGAPS